MTLPLRRTLLNKTKLSLVTVLEPLVSAGKVTAESEYFPPLCRTVQLRGFQSIYKTNQIDKSTLGSLHN